MRSFQSDGSDVDIFEVNPTLANIGATSPEDEFNFTAFNTGSGLGARAVMYSSINRLSAGLECRDLDDDNFTTINTRVQRKSGHLSKVYFL